MKRRILQQEADFLAHHPNGDMVVTIDKQVTLLDNDGKYKASLNSPDTGRVWPDYIRSITISPQGHVYIVQQKCPLIRVFNESGKYLHSFTILTASENPNTPVDPTDAVIDRDGNLLVIESNRVVITVHTCPGGEITSQIKPKVRRGNLININVTVNSRKHILLHYSPHMSRCSRVVGMDYSGNELYHFIPMIDEDISKRLVGPCQIVCDSDDNIFIAMVVVELSNTGALMPKWNTGHIHKYSPTGAFLQCIDRGLYHSYGLSMAPDGSSIAVANGNNIVTYDLK